jgi:hypothetical protein
VNLYKADAVGTVAMKEEAESEHLDVEETVATGVIQKWRLVLMMSSEETVVMLMMMSVEAVVMLMMMSVETVVMLMMTSVEAVVMLMMMSAEAVEVVVVVMAAATAYDPTRSADHL